MFPLSLGLGWDLSCHMKGFLGHFLWLDGNWGESDFGLVKKWILASLEHVKIRGPVATRCNFPFLVLNITYLAEMCWFIWNNTLAVLFTYFYFVVAGRSESILWCAWARRKSPRRSAFGDDRPECDRVHRWFKNGDIWWLGFALPHPLWP